MKANPLLTLPFFPLPNTLRILIGLMLVSRIPCSMLHGQVDPASVYRFATYNIKTFSEDISPVQKESIIALLDAIEADIIGMQEISDRNALEQVFDTSAWSLVIDDESGRSLDLAVAVRKPIKVVSNLNAEDEDFLFPIGNAENNLYFPGRRDVLHVKLQFPGLIDTFHVLVVHAKSRNGGIEQTAHRREGAAVRLLQALDQQFDEVPFVLLGDFNDNPDDAALNILETGDPTSTFQIENEPGSFLINLTERLAKEDQVSWNLSGMDIAESTQSFINKDVNSRSRNAERKSAQMLFDQILIPRWLYNCYVKESITIYNGIENAGASDHLPVFADIIVSDPLDHDSIVLNNLLITKLLPNPEGTDVGNETLTLHNFSDKPVPLLGWSIADRAGHELGLADFPSAGSQLSARQILDLVIPTNANNTRNLLPLTNSGDEIRLINPQGEVIQRIIYGAEEALSGNEIRVLLN